MDGWLKQIGDEGKDIHAYFVSVDPERDTPDVMNTYVSNFSAAHRRHHRRPGQGGTPWPRHSASIGRRSTLDDGDYTMDHTASVLLLDATGEFAGTIAYGESADTAIAKLKRLAAG